MFKTKTASIRRDTLFSKQYTLAMNGAILCLILVMMIINTGCTCAKPDAIRIYNRGMSSLNSTQLDKSLTNTSKTTEIDPNYTKTYVANTQVFTQEGKLDNTRNEFPKALVL